MQLEVDLVVEHVLAEGAAEHGLHRVLRHGVHAQPVDVGIAVLAVGTLVHLWGTQPPPGSLFSVPTATVSVPRPPARDCTPHPAPLRYLKCSPTAQPFRASPAPAWSPLMFLVALKKEGTPSYLGRRCVWRLQENLSAPSLLGLMMLEGKAEDVIQQPGQASPQKVHAG